MTYYLYKGMWYGADREDPSTMEPLLMDMLECGDLEGVFSDVAESRYASVADLALDLLDRGEERVMDEMMAVFMQVCTDEFDELAMPHIEASQEEEP